MAPQESSAPRKDQSAERPRSPSTGRSSFLLTAPGLELAKGGGALKGQEDSFRANPVTGSASVTVPLPFSGGRGGAAPQLALAYDSGSGNGPFGVGWNLDLLSIGRQTSRRLPLYGVDTDVFSLAGAEDLVPVEEMGTVNGYRVRRYQPRVEGAFARIECWTPADGVSHWRVYHSDGSVLYLGMDAESRIADPEHPQRIFRWLISRQVDALGHVVCFRYLAEDAQRYLSTVLYGNKTPFTQSNTAEDFLFALSLDYEERPDPFTERRAGFAVRTAKRCSGARMQHRFAELGTNPLQVASLVLDYSAGDSGVSLLTMATRRGHRVLANGSEEIKSLPPLTFVYQTHAWNTAWQDFPTQSWADLPGGFAAAQWLDLWGDGLPGLLTERGDAWYYKRNLGKGLFAPAQAVSPRPRPGRASGLLDIEGDGHLWLVEHAGSAAGASLLDESGKWQTRRAFKQAPKVDFNSPYTRFVDLDGDGRAEVVLDEADCIRWYPSEGAEGYGALEERRKDMEGELPRLVARGRDEVVFVADMSGDGLADVVRVREGEICYWPGLGHGRFGAKIVLGNPHFAHPGLFRPEQVRLADVDGSGPADLLYMDNAVARVWLNRGGESLCAERRIALPGGAGTRTELADVLGLGTACLVWSSGLAADAQKPARYLDLMAGRKPQVMCLYRNGMGKEIRLTYTASTVYSLADRACGEEWATRLPYVVQCLSRVETVDRVTGWSHASRYTYHHGCHDGFEREFRGFGRVDTMDSEVGTDPETDQPPVLTRSWFHLGVAPDGKWLPALFSKEYWKPEEHDTDATACLEAQLPAGLSSREWKEAHRAFKGRVLREEVYAPDAAGNAGVPYVVTDHSYHIQLQTKGLIPGDRFHPSTVWLVTEQESMARHHEQDASDPRIAQTLVLAQDAYGRPLLSAAVVYARSGDLSALPAAVQAEQKKCHVVVTENSYTQDTDAGKTGQCWRMGMGASVHTWELTGTSPSASRYTAAELALAMQGAAEITFETSPSSGVTQKRLVECVDVEYWDDTLSGARTDGRSGLRGLAYQKYSLAWTSTLLAHVYNGKVTTAMLTEGGYALRSDGNWWLAGGRHVYASDAVDHFCLPVGVLDSFAKQTAITYDSYDLLLASVTDSLGNTVSAQNDYRTLSPVQMTDPNGNRTAVETDALGIVIKTAVMGKVGANEGDTLSDPTSRMEYGFATFNATTGHVIQPSWVRSYSRETHANPNTRWLQKVEYSDGHGRVQLTKAQAEPGLYKVLENGTVVEKNSGTALRWVGTGRTVLNNKGNPVKQYEPYFSLTDAWENEPEIVETGVTPVLYYDALSRLIRTDFPDGTYSKVEFTAWEQQSFDQNDTVLDSQWYKDRGSPDPSGNEPSNPDTRAAWLAAQHANTPTTTHLDSLGRAFYVVTDNGKGQKPVTRTVLDIEGNEKAIYDAKTRLDSNGNPIAVMEYRYGIHGEKGYTKSMDAGERWMMLAVDGNPLYTWDSRNHRLHAAFDELRRPTEQWLLEDYTQGGSEVLVGKTVYGETASNPTASNLRGKPWKAYDQSGLTESVAYDFKGNLLESRRQFTTVYNATIDWNVAPALESEVFTTLTAYDALNRATSIKTPHNANIPASEVLPSYNEASLLEAVNVKLRGASTATNFVANINYDAKGQRERIQYGNGATTRYTYEEKTFRLSRLLTTRNSGADILQDLNYTYDPVGNIAQIVDDAQQTVYFNGSVVSPSQTFEYDALYRLTKATGREHAQSNDTTEPELDAYGLSQGSMPSDATALRGYERKWNYDEVGNIVALIHSANSNGQWNRAYNYAATSNRLESTTVGQTRLTYAHNVHGSMTSMPHLSAMDWDFAERLSHVQKGSDHAYYNYDGSGQRIRKVVVKGNITETRLYLGGFEVYRKSIGGLTDTERETLHVMDDKKRVAMVETLTVENGSPVANLVPTQRYQLDNHLGSASLELDDSANVISYEEYYPYGDTSYQAGRSASEVSQKRYRYTGKEKDEESGLYYHGARYYACWLGRWTASDPAGLVDGVNLYMYVRGNPVRLSDPSGNASEMVLDEVEVKGKGPKPAQGHKAEKVIDPKAIENFGREMIFPQPNIVKQKLTQKQYLEIPKADSIPSTASSADSTTSSTDPVLFTGTLNWNMVPSDRMLEGVEFGMFSAADALTKIRDFINNGNDKQVQDLMGKYFGIDSSAGGMQNKEYVKSIINEMERSFSKDWTIEKEEIPGMEDALLRVETVRKTNTIFINPKWGDKVFTSPEYQTRFQLLHELTHKASTIVQYDGKRHPIVDYYSKQGDESVVPSISDVQQWAKDDPNKALSSVWNYHYFFVEVINATRGGL